MLFLFIKDYHQIQVQQTKSSYQLSFSEEIDQWVETTWQKYKVNIIGFCMNWIIRFSDNEDQWPVSHRKKSHRKKSNSNWRKYDY